MPWRLVTIAAVCGLAAVGVLSFVVDGPTYAIDGDTIMWRGESVRVVGVDTPEIHGRCALEIELARSARRFTAAELDKGETTIERIGRDRFGRTLAIVRIGRADLADLLIAAGYGRPYHGERRKPWC